MVNVLEEDSIYREVWPPVKNVFAAALTNSPIPADAEPLTIVIEIDVFGFEIATALKVPFPPISSTGSHLMVCSNERTTALLKSAVPKERVVKPIVVRAILVYYLCQPLRIKVSLINSQASVIKPPTIAIIPKALCFNASKEDTLLDKSAKLEREVSTIL